LFVQEDRAIATTTTRKRAAAATGSKPKAASKAKTAAAKTPAAASKTKTAKTTSATKKTAPARKTGMTKVTEAAAKAASKLPATKPKTAKNTTAPKAAAKPAPKKSSIPAAVLKLHQAILTSLDDDKAENIVSIDLTGKSSIADFLVVASGRSSRQVAAIAEHLVERVSKETGRKVRAEGKAVGDWVLIDTGDIVVHIFRPEVRSFYNLEKMWGGATIPEPAAA
jgi:ribosome-associated protein